VNEIALRSYLKQAIGQKSEPPETNPWRSPPQA
jgi:hypothetical protein